MSRAEFLQLASHVLIVIGSFILYRTGSHITRVWREMRAELWLLRSLMKNRSSTASCEKREGGISIETGSDFAQSLSTENVTRPPAT